MLTVGPALAADPPPGSQPEVVASPISLRAYGLQVASPGYDSGDADILPFFASYSGTTLVLIATAPKGAFIDFVNFDSKLLKFADDKGTNLLTGTMRFGSPGFGPSWVRSKDGKGAKLDIRAVTQPASGATAVLAEGTVAFIYSPSGELKQVRNENVELKKGIKIPIGGTALEVSKVEDAPGDFPHHLQFTSNLEPAVIPSIKFLDLEGKEIEFRKGNFLLPGKMGDQRTYGIDFFFKKKVDQATVVIDAWPDATTVKVPFALKVGLGL